MAACELDVTADAHLDYYADLAARAHDEMTHVDQAGWLERLRQEHDNIRAALSRAAEAGRVEAGLRLAGGLRLFWYFGGHRQEGLSWLRRLLATDSPVPADVRGYGFRVAGALAALVGENDLAIACHREALAIFRELGETCRIADCLLGMADTLDLRGDRNEAVPLLAEARSLVREEGHRGCWPRS